MIKIMGIICLLVLLSGCSISQEDCRAIAYKQVEEFKDMGYGKGLDKGLDICEGQYKQMLEQYNPPPNCMILIVDDISARNICEGDEYYNELKPNH